MDCRTRILTFRLLFVCRADLDEFRLGRNLRLYVCVQFRRVAIWVGTCVRIVLHDQDRKQKPEN
jgi:hypothetical protein